MAIISTRKKNQNFKVINTEIYNPKIGSLVKGQEESCHFATYYCKHPENCEAYNNGMCFLKNGYTGSSCPFGEIRRKEGLPISHYKYYTVLNGFQFKNSNTMNKLRAISRIIKIGDEYYFLPLQFLDNNTNPISGELEIIKGCLLPKENFTVDNLIKLIIYRPKYPSGEVIDYYISKLVPDFVFQLKYFYNEIYQEINKKIINLESDVLSKVNYLNKYAKVQTLAPGSIRMNNYECYWDGEKIICHSGTVKDLFGVKSKEQIIMTCCPNTICQIVDANTVLKTTEFV